MRKLDLVGYAVLIAMLSGLAWVPFTLKYAKYQQTQLIKKEARLEAEKTIHIQMKKSCTCWFNDSRCKANSVVLACTKPEFMK